LSVVTTTSPVGWPARPAKASAESGRCCGTARCRWLSGRRPPEARRPPRSSPTAAVLQWRLDPVASADQPGAGGNVRGTPGRARQRRPPSPGRRVGIEVDDAGPLGTSSGHSWPSRARVPPACPLLQQDATDLAALDGDPQLVGRLDQRIQRPHTGLLGVDRSQVPSACLTSRPVGSWPTKATSWHARSGRAGVADPTGVGHRARRHRGC
jgi:hypothetical protein